MALITETNSQYYEGEQYFTSTGQVNLKVAFNIALNDYGAGTPPQNANYTIAVNTLANPTVFTDLAVGTYSVVNNLITIPAQAVGVAIRVKLKDNALFNSYGGYEYVPLQEIINNFMMAYVGPDKLISKVKRTDVIFHAKRGLQEFSYDTLKSIRKVEITVPPSLSYPIPQDYVNYVRIGWTDDHGVFHPIKPANLLTQYPTEVPIQDDIGLPTQDDLGENLQSAQSITVEKWKKNNDNDLTGAYLELYDDSNIFNWTWRKNNLGRRYGLDPVISQSNGWYVIDRRHNKFAFSSDLANRCVILEYISDGLAYDIDIKIPKMAEEAMYMHIAYSILAGRAGVQEFIVQRFKRDRSAQLRNAKIRLSNMKLGEMIQNMRGKSKWIKH
tara:strand:- start:13926 stop:15080 length:1155 start_codon:yes stop_codon:yes gene_type:complete